MSDVPLHVVELTVEQTHPLRRAVLRNGDPNRSVDYAEDTDPQTFHLGVHGEEGGIVATSSWAARPSPHHPGRNAVQLRGMATAEEMQGVGVGGLLFEAGVALSAARGFDLLWAKARDTALAFYLRHGCEVVGDGFIDEPTQLPHHVVIRESVPPTNFSLFGHLEALSRGGGEP